MKNTNSNNPLWRRTSLWWKNAVAALGFSAMLFSPAANAQFVIIGTDAVSTAGNGSDPVDDYFQYMRYQTVYLASELSVAGMTAGSTITALGFSVIEDNGPAFPGYTIGLAHTASTNSAAHNAAATTTVFGPASYDATATGAGVHDMITFSTGFVWNGTDNILVNICSGTTAMGYASPYGGVRAAALTSGSRSVRSDVSQRCGTNTSGANANRPQIRFNYTAPAACAGMPNAGSVTTPVTVCAGSTTTLNASGLTTGLGITYQWEESPDGIGSWADVVVGSGGTTGSYTTDAILGTRYFRIRTDCSTGPDSNNSNVVTVNADPGSTSEDFSSGNLTANCWATSGTVASPANFNYATQSGYGVGTGSIRYNFYSVTGGETLIYTSPIFPAIGSGQQMEFDVAGTTYTGGEVDQITLEESNDGGANWTTVVVMTNAVGDVLNTTGATQTGAFVPTAVQWASLAYGLSAGTNRVRFNGVSDFGNAVYIDNIAIGAAPTCQAPTGAGASNITTVGADIAWTCTSCTGTFIVEYGAPGFIPGTDGNAGTGTIWTGAPVAGSPVTLTGLTSATAYSVVIREVCPGPDYSPNSTVANFTTACDALNVPFAEDFSGVTIPSLPTCWSTDDVNGPSPVTGAWITGTAPTGFTNNVARYAYSSTAPADDWLISPGLNLTGGTTYTISYKYAAQSASFPEAMDVYYGTAPAAASLTNLIVDHGTFNFTAPSSVSYTITPGSTDVYYIGWHAYSGADEFNLNLDDISVVEAPPCPDPTGVSVSGTTFNSTNVNFTCSGCTGDVIVEYGPAGYTPGTAGTAGVGGTLVSGTATSPQAIGGLMENTSYDVYVRQDCSVSLDGYSDNSALVNFTTPFMPPANDDCANAIPLNCNTLVTGTTINASTEVPAPAFCGTGLTAPGVWYTVAGFDGPMFATLCGSTAYDSKINVYTGSCGAWVCVGGNDDNFSCASNTASSRLDWTGSSANTYYILVQGFSSATGAFDLFVGCGSNNNSCPDNGLAIEFQTDNAPFETTWDLLDATGQYVVASGGPLAAPGALLQEFACVPDGCYQFRVNDVNGMSTGGYVVRTQGTNIRIIDNANNFSTGPVSTSGEAFCLPLGTTELLYSSCDKYFWANGEYIVCNEDPAVAADYNGGGAAGADSGYDFWFFDPNGSYSYVRSRRHNVSDNYANVGSTRTCHMKINNWAAVNHIPNGLKLNVRVRSVVNGVAGAYGPACRFTRDEATAACPPTLLFDVPGFPQFYSCGVNRDFVANTQNRLYARPVAGATQYRFTFDNAELVSPIVRTSNNYYLTLGWAAIVAPPLVPGQSYDVTVEAFKGGNWCVPGNVCIVTINNAVAGGQQNVALDGGPALNMWPNPNNGDVLNMSLLVSDPFINVVSMDIFDLSGKRMIARTVAIQDGLVNTTIDLNGDLADGMYMVKVTAGEEVFTQRVVIQK